MRSALESRPVAGPWEWWLHSPAELECWLEDYRTYDLGMGEPDDGGDPDIERRDRRWRIYAQNRVIDIGMRDLWLREGNAAQPRWHLLHGYYRMGLWALFRGWHEVAQRWLKWDLPDCAAHVRCRVPGDDRIERVICRVGQGCPGARARFEELRAEAIRALYAAIVDRQQRTFDTGSGQW